MEQLYSLKQAREILSVSEATLRRLIKSGHLRVIRLTEKSNPRVPQSALDKLTKEK